MKIGFIGCGNMATAIIDGIIKGKEILANDIYAYDVYSVALDKVVDKYKINACENEIDVIKNADVIVLAVKPNVLAEVVAKINYTLENTDKVLISIAAGKTIEFIRSNLTHNAKIIRVMPNINAMVGEAICGYTVNTEVTEQDKINAEAIFNGVGQLIYLEEKDFPIFGVLGGCTPAYAYMFIDAIARVGVQNGMKKEVALMIAAQSIYGSAKMIMESNENPYALVDKVCSPGGTTIEGVISLQEDGFESAVHKAINKAIEKDSKL